MIKQRRLLHAVLCLRQWYDFSYVRQILVIHTLAEMVWHRDDFMGNRDSLPIACVWFFLSLFYINVYIYITGKEKITHAFTSSVSNYIYSSHVNIKFTYLSTVTIKPGTGIVWHVYDNEKTQIICYKCLTIFHFSLLAFFVFVLFLVFLLFFCVVFFWGGQLLQIYLILRIDK